MRIVYILTSLGMGGAERQALAIAERMAKRGHQVCILTLRERLRTEWPTTLPVHHLNMHRSLRSVAAGLIHARRMLCDFRPDLIHSHCFHANIFARLLQPLIPRVAVVSTIHNVYEGGRRRMLAYRLTDPLVCRTTAVSRDAAERFIRLKAVPARKCLQLSNAIDMAIFTPKSERRAEIRASIAATTDSDFIWLAAGRYAPAKDYPNLIAAFAEVKKSAPHAHLWVAGQPSSGHNEQRRTGPFADIMGIFSLRVNGRKQEGAFIPEGSPSRDPSQAAPSLPASPNPPSRIHFVGLRRDMPALFDAADGFVLSSAWEGMPLVLAEAMAMEKPVVSTDVGGVRELLGESGVIVPPKDPNALASAMLSVMAQPREERRTWGRAARNRIAQSFDIECRAGEWESLYLELLDSGA